MREREPVDLDRLAEYVDGLLTGTPREAEVTRELGRDPAAAALAGEVRAAAERVRAELAGLADPPVPPEVAARLDATLAAARGAATDPARAGASDRAASDQAASDRAASDHAASDRAVAGPDVSHPDRVPRAGAPEGGAPPSGRGAHRPAGSSAGTRPGPARPARRGRRRVAAWAGAVAVAVLAVGAVTANLGDRAVQVPSDSAAGQVSGDSVGRSEAVPRAAAPPATLPPVTASGRDYQPGTLAEAARGGVASTAGTAANTQAHAAQPAAIRTCVDDLTNRYRAGVRLVDVALFRGEPALIVVMDTTPERVIVVPIGCGTPEVGTREIYSTTA
jgi:hypothetical protein